MYVCIYVCVYICVHVCAFWESACLQKAGRMKVRMVEFSAQVYSSLVSAMVYSPRCQASLVSVGIQLNRSDLLRISQEDGPVRHLGLNMSKNFLKHPPASPHKSGGKVRSVKPMT